MQIVQELCRRPGLNKCGFEMSTIYIPNPQKVCISLWNLDLLRHFRVERSSKINSSAASSMIISSFFFTFCFFSRAAV